MGIFSSVSLPAISMPTSETNLISGCASSAFLTSSLAVFAGITYSNSSNMLNHPFLSADYLHKKIKAMPKGTISYAVDDKIILSARLHCLIILLDKTYIITEKGTCKAFSFGRYRCSQYFVFAGIYCFPQRIWPIYKNISDI